MPHDQDNIDALLRPVIIAGTFMPISAMADMIADDITAARRFVAQVKDHDVQHVHVFVNNAPSPRPTLSVRIPRAEWRLAW